MAADAPVRLSPDAPSWDVPTWEQWRAQAQTDLKGQDLDRKLRHVLLSGVVVEPLYGLHDVPPDSVAQVPLTVDHRRAGTLLGTRNGWAVEADIDDATPADAAARIRAEAAEGLDAIVLHLASPDHRGVVVQVVGDLLPIIDAIGATGVRVSLAAGSATVAAAALFAAAWQAHGLNWEALRGHVHADPVGGGLANGALVDGGFAAASALVHWLSEHEVGWSLALDASPYFNAGADEATTLGITLGALAETLRALDAHGVAPDAAADQLAMQLPVGHDLFLGVALFRAARVTTSRLLAACEAAPSRALPLAARTATRTLSRRDPWVNLLRGTSQAVAAIVGGAGSIVIHPYTQAMGRPEDQARRFARNTQLVLREEAHLHRVIDPAGGAYAFERLTDDTASAAWATLQRLEADGGLLAAWQDGALETLIAPQRASSQRNVATRKQPLLGVSEYANLDETVPPLAGEEAGHYTAVATGSFVAGSPATAFADAIAAATAGASLTTLCAGFSLDRTHSRPALSPVRDSAAFEHLVDRSAVLRGGPHCTLITLGALAAHNGRATFAGQLLAAGGLAHHRSEAIHSANDAVAAWKAAPTRAVIVCGSDADYETLGEAALVALKEAGVPRLFLAGRPGPALVDAPIDGALFLGCDVIAFLTELLDFLGAPSLPADA